MNFKLFLLGACVGTSILSGCNDELSSIGTSIQPDDDSIAVFTDTFRIQTTTVALDSIYARTTTAQLGELYDPLYGNLKSDFLCQFYCPEGFKFAHEPIDGRIDSVRFRIFYANTGSGSRNGSWVGDSLAPMRAEVFRVTSPLVKSYYTNTDPADFCDMKESLGAQTYTAYNALVSDSVRNDDYYTPSIVVNLPTELGQRFYDETINNPASFASQEAFNEFMPGVYVTTTFGSGNILSVSASRVQFYYTYMTQGYLGNDSTAVGVESFASSQEVIQLSHFQNSDIDHLLADEEFTYIKTPAGVCTKVIIPTKQIASLMADRIINQVPLTLHAMPQEDWEYAFDAPSTLLVIPEDSVRTFFENGKVEDNLTAFIATNSTTDTKTYTQTNLANLVKKQIDEHPDEDLRLLVIPVTQVTENNGYTSYTTAVNHYMAPSGIKFRKDDEVTLFHIISSKYAGEEI